MRILALFIMSPISFLVRIPSKFHGIDTNVKDLFENNQFQWMAASGVSSIVELPIKHAIEAITQSGQPLAETNDSVNSYGKLVPLVIFKAYPTNKICRDLTPLPVASINIKEELSLGSSS
ncbi:hypothetical protein [Brevibacillus reuszeri]|uniref:hypothetical protein n=1 Tax=Brevibacillus reuszeri TaxID=54915 RepID=UPI0028A257E4|nr:hypothetical protein [Brevibacillus reuszeri]